MTEELKRRITWGILLMVGALGCASLRNNPALGIQPLAIAVIEGLIYVCLLVSMRLADWRITVLTALVTPVYLWMQRFLDGFMIPVEILVNITLIGCMYAVRKHRLKYHWTVLLLIVPTILVMLLGNTAALCLVKDEGFIRSFVFAWNTDVYTFFSLIGAVLVSVPFQREKARA